MSQAERDVCGLFPAALTSGADDSCVSGSTLTLAPLAPTRPLTPQF